MLNLKPLVLFFVALLPAFVFSAAAKHAPAKLGCMMCHQGQEAHLDDMTKKNDKHASSDKN